MSPSWSSRRAALPEMSVDEVSPEETHKQRVDRELSELLEELRVAIPGAEVLFAFLLGVAFTSRFTTLSSLQRDVYFTTMLLAAGAIALLIAPAAQHRLGFRTGDKERLLFSSTRMALGALAMILLAIAGALFVVADLLYGTPAALGVAGLSGSWFTWFWFLMPRRAATRRG